MKSRFLSGSLMVYSRWTILAIAIFSLRRLAAYRGVGLQIFTLFLLFGPLFEKHAVFTLIRHLLMPYIFQPILSPQECQLVLACFIIVPVGLEEGKLFKILPHSLLLSFPANLMPFLMAA